MAGALVHAVAINVAVDADGPLAGILLLGDSGVGKTRLAFGLVEHCPWQRTALIADDAVSLRRAGAAIYAASPGSIAGMAEIRGVGPVPLRRAGGTAPIIAGIHLDPSAPRVGDGELREVAPDVVLTIWRLTAADAALVRPLLRSILGGQFTPSAHDREQS